MSWQVLLTISVVTYSFSVLLQRVLLKNDKSDPVAYVIVFQLLTGLLIGIYAVFNGFSTPDIVPLIPNLVLMTGLYGAGNVFIFKALKLVDASEFTIIFASRALWTIIGAVIFLGESLSFQQVVGTLLIILSVMIVSWTKREFSFGKGAIYSVLAALFFGLAFANDAYAITNFDVPSYLTIGFVLPGLAVWMTHPKSTTKMRPLLERKTFIKLGLLGIMYAVSAITIFLAYQVGRNAAQIAPLNQVSTILTVVLSVALLKERTDLLKKLIGAVISFVAVVLLV